MVQIIILFLLCALISIVVIRFAISLTLAYDIGDTPGEKHKRHEASTPFIGGSGVLASLCIMLAVFNYNYPEQVQQWLTLGLCSIVIFSAGFIDDMLKLSYKIRLVIQAIVVLVMILSADILLNDLGVFFDSRLQLGLFAVPFTVFAAIGCINALNMIDGIDGLSGSVSLVTLVLISIVALVADNTQILFLAITLAGGIVGFLYFNLRYPSQHSARVFLGDNGSMLLGFLFAWLLIDLSQGFNAAIHPVTALWLFSFPLMDAVSVIQRRIWVGKSPFSPDFNHLHHILLKAGFRVEEVVTVIVLLHISLGMIGLIGLYQEIPQFIMLLGFLIIYYGYFRLTLKPWNFIPTIRYYYTRLGFTSSAKKDVFSGRYTAEEAKKCTQIISRLLGPSMDFWVKIYEQQLVDYGSKKHYAIALNIRLPEDDTTLDNKIEECVELLPKKLKEHNIQLRQFVARYGDRDRRSNDRRSTIRNLHSRDNRAADRRNAERRDLNPQRRTAQRRATERDTVDRRFWIRRGLDRRISDRHKLGAHVLVFEVT